MKNKCIFCQIVEGRVPTRKVYEDMNYLAFHDTNPKAPVHVLIIPKKHIPTLNDFEDKEIISELLPTIKKVAEELKIENAYKLVIHVGEDAGQVIFHLHVHMMGGWHHRQTD